MEATRPAVRRGGARRRGDDRLHHAHAGRRRPRPVPRRAGRGAPRQAPRGAAPLLRRLHGPGPGLPGRPQRAVLHDRAGPEALAARQRRQRPARRRSRGGCGSRSTRTAPRKNVPIGHITNGVHVQTWVAPQMHLLFDRHLGRRLAQATSGIPETWEGIETVDDAELWETQQVLKARLIDFVRNRLVAQARRRNEPDAADPAGDGGPRPERPDDRLRPAVRHLQAGRPGPPGRRAADRDGQGHRPARSRSSSPARPTPRTAWARS